MCKTIVTCVRKYYATPAFRNGERGQFIAEFLIKYDCEITYYATVTQKNLFLKILIARYKNISIFFRKNISFLREKSLPIHKY